MTSRSFSYYFAALLVIFGIVGVLYSYVQTRTMLEERQLSQRSGSYPVATLDRTEFDWGKIPRDAVVTQDFLLSNTGSGPLEVTFVATSCGCTTATLLKNDQVLSVPLVLAASDGVTVHVEFDPAAHDSRGDTKRAVRIETNDPSSPFLIINLLADVE